MIKKTAVLILIVLVGWPDLSRTQTKLMLIGDSITEGMQSGSGLGFRDDVLFGLTGEGFSIRLVGSEGDYPFEGFFHAGAEIRDFYYGPGGLGTYDVGQAIEKYKPDVLMIHLGTNGVDGWREMGPYVKSDGQTLHDGTLSGHLANLLAYVARWRNGQEASFLKKVIVSRIIERVEYEDETAAFNAEIDRMTADADSGKIASSIPPGLLRVADQYAAFDTSSMLSSDLIHPNDQGYAAMGQVYIEAFESLPMQVLFASDSVRYGNAGEELPEPLAVEIKDGYESPLPNEIVWFEVTEGDAAIIAPATVRTDSFGCASVRILGGHASESRVRAHTLALLDSVADFTIYGDNGLTVAGEVVYAFGGKPVPDVTITWEESGIAVDTSDAGGRFSYSGFPEQGSVTLTPYRETVSPEAAAVLMYDAALTARYALGLEHLTSEPAAAADVNQDGRISLLDASFIARYAMGLDHDPANSTGSWLFFPDTIRFDPLVQSLTDEKISAILRGDLHGGWDQQTAGKAVQSGLIESEIHRNGDSYQVMLKTTSTNLLSFEMDCRYLSDDLELLAVTTGLAPEFSLYRRGVDSDYQRIGLFGMYPADPARELLVLRFRSKTNSGTKIASFTKVYLNDVRLSDMSICLEEGGTVKVEGDLRLFANHPNPFNGNTVISYETETGSRIGVKIYNHLGRLVRNLSPLDSGPGVHSLVWDGCDQEGRPLASGMYICVVTDEAGRRQVGKMELIR